MLNFVLPTDRLQIFTCKFSLFFVLTKRRSWIIIKFHRLRAICFPVKKVKKLSRKLLTKEATHDILNELRLERAETQNLDK